MSPRDRVTLTEQERKELEALTKRGKTHARRFIHARALLLSDAGAAGTSGRFSYSAATTIAEIGDLARFEHPRKFMAYLGLIPSEHTSGDKRRQGSITKTGNGHVRKVLVEAAHAYQHPARVTRFLLKRQENLNQDTEV